jgi:hypothetical protein
MSKTLTSYIRHTYDDRGKKNSTQIGKDSLSFEILIFHIALSACVISTLYSFLQALNLHITCNELIDVNWNSISLTIFY